MKQTKRLTSTLLALALVLTLAVPLAMPAMAAGEIVITQHPSSPGRVMMGEKFTLRVAAKAPAGETLRYQWYAEYGTSYRRRNIGSNSSTLTTVVADRDFPIFGTSQVVTYRCEITSSGGKKITSAAASVEASMTVANAFWHGIKVTPNFVFNIPRTDLLDSKIYSNILMIFLLPLILPIAPFLAPIWLPVQALLGR